jgi:hypothetical protein
MFEKHDLRGRIELQQSLRRPLVVFTAPARFWFAYSMCERWRASSPMDRQITNFTEAIQVARFVKRQLGCAPLLTHPVRAFIDRASLIFWDRLH